MKRQKLWNQLDSKDAKILALTTKIDLLQQALELPYFLLVKMVTKRSMVAASRGRKNVDQKRTKKGDSIVLDGKTWYWYPHHKYEGQYDCTWITNQKIMKHRQ